MNRKQKNELRRHLSTQQLMGIDRLTDHGMKTAKGELVFYLISPDNLSVLSSEGVSGRVRALTDLLRGMESIELLALDSRESFLSNKHWYQERLEKEELPALRELLRQDMAHLDEIQSTSASAREFALAYRIDDKTGDDAGYLAQIEKRMLFADNKKWTEVLDAESEGHTMLKNFLDELEYFPESLRNFRGQIMGMLEMYFDPLVRRNTDAYAMAYAYYFDGMSKMGDLFFDRPFEQSFSVEVSFVPIPSRDDVDRPVLAEATQFSYLSHFLYTDFYRGLIAGNIPRRCHNCGRYFLLTAGYNTCYCNNIAPGEIERTCRKVGAHRKEAKVLAGKTPGQNEFRRTYNRLKQRKNRGKISVDDWNAAVARAQEILEEAEHGKLSDAELKDKLAAL